MNVEVLRFSTDVHKFGSKRAPSTFNRDCGLLLMVFRVLRNRNGHSPANPWAAIQRKRAKNGRGRREFDDEELRRIFLTLERRAEGGRIAVWYSKAMPPEIRAQVLLDQMPRVLYNTMEFCQYQGLVSVANGIGSYSGSPNGAEPGTSGFLTYRPRGTMIAIR